MFSFQKDSSVLSVDDLAYYNGLIPEMDEFTICYWEFINFFSDKINVPISYCYMEDSSMSCNLQFYSQRNFESMGSKVNNYITVKTYLMYMHIADIVSDRLHDSLRYRWKCI